MHHRNSRGALATTLSTHRIRTAQVAQRIVASTGLAPPVLVVEVGAGDGILTHELAARGLRVVAIERDRDAYCSLRDRFGASPLVTPVLADFLTCDLPHASPYVVFGNPPFSITSPILRRVLAASHAPDAIFLVLQREAAFRWGGFDRESLLSLTTRLRYEIDIRLALRRRDFDPAPAADCVLLAMTRRRTPLLGPSARQCFLSITAAAMRGRHRTVSASLHGLVDNPTLIRAARGYGFDVARPPSEPRFDEWIRLARALADGPGPGPDPDPDPDPGRATHTRPR